MGIHDINPNAFIQLVATELKKLDDLKKPEWAKYVKTSAGKERLPSDPDWWYMRTASILRKCYVHGPIGVNKLKTKYGCKKNRGVKPEKFYKGSGKIIRVILQQLEKKGFIKQTQKGVHKGRTLTGTGIKFLNQVIKNDKSAGNQEKN